MDKRELEYFIMNLCDSKSDKAICKSDCILLRWSVSEQMYELAHYLVKRGLNLSANNYESIKYIVKNNGFEFIVNLIEEDLIEVTQTLCNAIYKSVVFTRDKEFIKQFGEYIYQHSGVEIFHVEQADGKVTSVEYYANRFQLADFRDANGRLTVEYLPLKMCKEKLFEIDNAV